MGLVSLLARFIAGPPHPVVGVPLAPERAASPAFATTEFLNRPAEACRFPARRVMLAYVDVAGKESFRTVTVDEVVRQHGRLYLSAYCHERFDRRHFRLDRIVTMRRFADGAPVDPAVEIARWTRGG